MWRSGFGKPPRRQKHYQLVQPLEALVPALYTALTSPSLLLDSQAVPVYEHNAEGAQYVLIGQPTANRAGGSTACRIWDCTVLLDCVTLFHPEDVSSGPADAIASLVVSRLDGKRLPLAGGFQMGTATAETVEGLNDAFDGEETDVHRYVRMRFQLYLNS